MLPALPLIHGDDPVSYNAALAVLTATLVALVWYTCFTYESLEHLRESAVETRDQIRTAIFARAGRLLATLDQLPPDEGHGGEVMGDVATWESQELTELEGLAALHGPATANSAAEAVGALRWIDEKVQEVKGTSKLQGYRWQKFPWDKWENLMATAKRALGAVANATKR